MLEALHRLRIVEGLGRELHAGRARPRLRHRLEHAALLRGEALHRFDEVRDEVGAPLVLILDLGPGRVDVLLLDDELVVDADGPDDEAADHHQDHRQDHEHDDEGATHRRDYIAS